MKKYMKYILPVAILCIVATGAFAGDSVLDKMGNTDITGAISAALKFLMYVAFAVLIGAMMWTGVQYAINHDNPQAKKGLVAVIVAGIFLLLVPAISKKLLKDTGARVENFGDTAGTSTQPAGK